MDQLTKNIKLAEAKRAQLFSQIQSIYNLIPKIKEEDKSRQAFIVHGRHVDMIREEYKKVVDDVNSYNLEQDEDYVINYQSLTAFDELYFYIKAYLNKLEPPSSAAIPAASSACDYDKRKDSIKVPRIELPTFDGEIQSFPYFYETFKRIIHDNISLTDTERVHYLMSHLTGRARDICAGLVPAAENYEIIWQALITKYKDTRALGTSYLNQLFSLKPAGPSPMQLDKLIDKYAALIAALKQLKIPDLSEFIFVYMGLKLLDVETAKAYEMSIRGTSSMPGYDNFVSFIREQEKYCIARRSVPVLFRAPQSLLTSRAVK